MSRKYIVITTINPPTEAIYKLARLKNWNIIVIADKKTTTDWSHTNIEYISVNEQTH